MRPFDFLEGRSFCYIACVIRIGFGSLGKEGIRVVVTSLFNECVEVVAFILGIVDKAIGRSKAVVKKVAKDIDGAIEIGLRGQKPMNPHVFGFYFRGVQGSFGINDKLSVMVVLVHVRCSDFLCNNVSGIHRANATRNVGF